MSYEKQNFKDGQVLTAEMLNKMEAWMSMAQPPTVVVEITEILSNVALEQTDQFLQAIISQEASNAFKIGNEYKITWNGTEYSCVAQSGESLGMPTVVAMGNIGGATGGNDTGEPFVLLVGGDEGNYFAMAAPLTGDTSATITVVGKKETVTKLEEKFMPESFENIVLRSATSGSTKLFRVFVHDNGELSTVEVTV